MRLGHLLHVASSAVVFLPVVFLFASVNVARQHAPPERVVQDLAGLLVRAPASIVHPVAEATIDRAG